MAIETKCHYRKHLRGPDLTTYELALAVSKDSGMFFASTRYIASQTAYRAPETIREALDRLRRNGWLVQTAGNRDSARKGGKFTPNTYRVVTHDEWSTAHPGRCGSEPIRVSADTAQTTGADTATFPRADTAQTPYNLSLELSNKAAEYPSVPSTAWTAIGINPVGSATFQKRYERDFARRCELLGPLTDVPELLGFLQSFYSGCWFDGEPVPKEWTEAARRLKKGHDKNIGNGK